jgi:hypothetical protein
MKVARFEPWNCGKCGHMMDAATEAFGDTLPDEGDIALCIHCAEPHILEGHKWRVVTDDELLDMSLEDKQQIARVQTAIRSFRAGGQ